jgi:ribose/xylose/arabinose/galactoside ABC-type transport system permease subunit
MNAKLSRRLPHAALQSATLALLALGLVACGGEALVIPTGRTDLSVGACLRDPQA